MDQDTIDALPESIYITGNWDKRLIKIDGEILLPQESQKVINHSPDGFNWGYSGSGPAQTALAIMLKYLPKNDAINLYQTFKNNVVAGWLKSDFGTTVKLKEEIKKIFESKILPWI